MCDSRNFFGYEKRRVGGNIPEDCSILTERHIEKQHEIDTVCRNVEGNVNCTYTFVAKAKKYQRDDISKQLSRAFWKS